MSWGLDEAYKPLVEIVGINYEGFRAIKLIVEAANE